MDKEEFYRLLINSNESIKNLFESYSGNNYAELNDYILERVQVDFVFPNDKEQPTEGKPLIAEDTHQRVSVVARTIEEGCDYDVKNLFEATVYVGDLRRIENITKNVEKTGLFS